MKVVLYVIVALYDNTQITVANANTWYWDDKTGMLNVYDTADKIALSIKQDKVMCIFRASGNEERDKIVHFLDNLYKK